jgi:hypothetical protein
VRISPEIDRHCEANVFSLAEGSIWPRPLLRGRAGSPGSLAQGRLHRDDPGTEESSPHLLPHREERLSLPGGTCTRGSTGEGTEGCRSSLTTPYYR